MKEPVLGQAGYLCLEWPGLSQFQAKNDDGVPSVVRRVGLRAENGQRRPFPKDGAPFAQLLRSRGADVSQGIRGAPLRLESGTKSAPPNAKNQPDRVLVLATGNRHKVEEIRAILKGLPVKIIPLSECAGVPEVVEDGATLDENAVKKARTVALYCRKWTLADDTGLEVKYLNGEPGVFSARWAGPGCTYEDNNRKLLERLAGVARAKRAAKFRCVIALSDPQGRTWTVEGSIAGRITEEIKGKRGFGYDPLFLVPRYKKTFAELPSAVKNVVSHRAVALKRSKKLIKEHFLSV